MQNQTTDKTGISVNGDIDIFDGSQYIKVAELSGAEQTALYDCSPELGMQRVYSPNNPPPTGNIIDTDTTFNVPGDFPDIHSCISYLETCYILAVVTVQLADGVYELSSALTVNNLSVAGANGHLIIQGNPNDITAVTLRNSSTTDTSVVSILHMCNFTISNLYIDTAGKFMGLNIENSFINIKSIKASGTSGTSGSAIRIGYNCYVAIEGIQLTGSNIGSGLYLMFNSTVQLYGSNNVISQFVNGIMLFHSVFYCPAPNTCNISNCTTGVNSERYSYVTGSGLKISNCPTAVLSYEYSCSYLTGATISGTLSPSANSLGNIQSYNQR